MTKASGSAPKVDEQSAAAPPAGRGEIVSIQQLRGVAAVGVLCFHAAKKSGFDFGTGAAGVDVFFVISGFIMWVVSARGENRPGDFLMRRAARIIPLYWMVSLAVAALAMLSPALFPALKPTPGHIIQSLLFVPHLDPDGQPYPLIAPGWTLNYEVFFYVVFAAAIALAPNRRALLTSVTLLALVAAGRVLTHPGPALSAYTDPILLEFAAGLWLGVAYSKARLPGPRLGLALAGAGLAGFLALSLLGWDIAPARVLFWGVPAFALVVGAVAAERGGLVLRLPVLSLIGDASYSIYLVHGLAVSVAARLLTQLGWVSPLVAVAVSVAAGIGGGIVCWALVERPVGKALHRLIGRRRGDRRLPAPQMNAS